MYEDDWKFIEELNSDAALCAEIANCYFSQLNCNRVRPCEALLSSSNHTLRHNHQHNKSLDSANASYERSTEPCVPLCFFGEELAKLLDIVELETGNTTSIGYSIITALNSDLLTRPKNYTSTKSTVNWAIIYGETKVKAPATTETTTMVTTEVSNPYATTALPIPFSFKPDAHKVLRRQEIEATQQVFTKKILLIDTINSNVQVSQLFRYIVPNCCNFLSHTKQSGTFSAFSGRQNVQSCQKVSTCDEELEELPH